jgi:phage anti-repressor protein
MYLLLKTLELATLSLYYFTKRKRKEYFIERIDYIVVAKLGTGVAE